MWRFITRAPAKTYLEFATYFYAKKCSIQSWLLICMENALELLASWEYQNWYKTMENEYSKYMMFINEHVSFIMWLQKLATFRSNSKARTQWHSARAMNPSDTYSKLSWCSFSVNMYLSDKNQVWFMFLQKLSNITEIVYACLLFPSLNLICRSTTQTYRTNYLVN